jgi:predicted esterase
MLIKKWFVLISLLFTTLSFAEIPSAVCAHEDYIHNVTANHNCLILQAYTKQAAATDNTLLIFIHGDGQFGGPMDYFKPLAMTYEQSGVIPVVLIRPGYYDSLSQYSTGVSHRFTGDDYTADIIETVAAAIASLKQHYHAKCVVLIGHSGGAAISGVIFGKYPGLVNAGVLDACPCNVPKWQNEHHGAWPNSLSPHQYIEMVSNRFRLWTVTGSKDTNTPPALAENYAASLQEIGIMTKFILVPGATHDNIIATEENKRAIQEAIGYCQSI